MVMQELYGQNVLLGMLGQLGGSSVRLNWRQDLGKDIFQLSGQGMALPCSFVSTGTLGEYVEFLRGDNGDITGTTIKGLFPGIVFEKTTM